MKLVYSKNRCNETEVVHRFDVLGDFIPSDLEVLKKSLQFFFHQLEKSGSIFPVVVLDFSESTIKINESKLQTFVSEIKATAQASQAFISIAQSDIESMHAEQNAIEQCLRSQLNVLENKVDLMDSVKDKIKKFESENQSLREQLDESTPKRTARSFFEKLWGES